MASGIIEFSRDEMTNCKFNLLTAPNPKSGNVQFRLRQNRLTLEQRGTELPDNIVAFSNEFIIAKQVQWNAFRKKFKHDHVPAEFENIVMQVKAFINPIVSALTSRKTPPSKWAAPGPWA